MKIIEIIADEGHVDTIVGIAEQQEIGDFWIGATDPKGRSTVRMLVDENKRQVVLDALQSTLGTSETARILILPVETALPTAKPEEEPEDKPKHVGISREELYNAIESGSHLNTNFAILVILSTIVAAIGLLEDNVAVVIGAMVIAPLLGPNIALALGTSLGDTKLVWESAKTILAGLALALSLSFLLGVFWPYQYTSQELFMRTVVSLDSIGLALASGAAAVLSLTTGLSAVLVGVMVAVALLPPATTVGLMLGVGETELAKGAMLLLAVNIVSVNLAAKLTFLFKGVRPRTWIEKQKATQSSFVYFLIWIITLIVLGVLIWLRTDPLLLP